MTNELALQQKISDIVKEYDWKVSQIPNAISEYEMACEKFKSDSCVSGTWGQVNIDTGRACKHTIKKSLLKSAWLHIYNGLNIKSFASAKDQKLFERQLEDLPEFTMENIRATFGDYLLNPRQNILRGLAEVFCDLDPSYKSHDKVKIGVDGLPKRIIIPNVTPVCSYGREKLQDTINALACYQEKRMVNWSDINDLMKDRNSLKEKYGVSLKTFRNGNGHLIFEKETLKDINMALAEYYGDVLPDCATEKEKPQSTEVSKDLQYYPTPQKVIDKLFEYIYQIKNTKVLEPSCGCGRIMDRAREMGAEVFGIEYNFNRVKEAREKGHKVLHANFLETVPEQIYDFVIMNPPFYGKHYAKHVKHALRFLKPNGKLFSILPITARYDHKILDGDWWDLPVGSFSESGTNINTTILKIWNRV